MSGAFEIYRRDWQAQACARTIDVFRRAPVLRQIQTVQIRQSQELYDALIDSLPARTLEEARGTNLDVIGRIVGVWPRPLVDAGDLVYFEPDSAEGMPDNAPVFVTGAPENGLVEVGDVEYRRRIRAKIIKNGTKYGSAPEIMYWAQFAYGTAVSVRSVGLSDLSVTLRSDIPTSIIREILGVSSDDTSDLQFNLPLPTTSRIVQVFFKPPDAFAPDSDLTAPDRAYVGVGYGLNP